jgi:glutamate synthase domain-containing protein 1
MLEPSDRWFRTARILAGIAILSFAVILLSGIVWVAAPRIVDRWATEAIESQMVRAILKEFRHFDNPTAEELKQRQALHKEITREVEEKAKQQKQDVLSWTTLVACVSFITLILSAMGTSSSILLGWRADRRQSDEFKLKIQHLELQLAEAKATAVKKNLDIVA